MASFAFASAHKYETAGKVEGNDVILTEARGCPLHVLGPKVGAGTTNTHTHTHTLTHTRTHTHTHTHTPNVSYSEIPSSNLPRNKIASQILFILFFWFFSFLQRQIRVQYLKSVRITSFPTTFKYNIVHL